MQLCAVLMQPLYRGLLMVSRVPNLVQVLRRYMAAMRARFSRKLNNQMMSHRLAMPVCDGPIHKHREVMPLGMVDVLKLDFPSHQ